MACFKEKDVEICLIGHDSVRLKTNDLIIYIDPFANKDSELYTKADVILITHEHYDHCDEELVKKISDENTIIITPLKCKERLNITENRISLSAGEEIEVKGIKVKAVEAYNIDKPFHPKGLGVGYIIDINGLSLYHTGDTDFIPEMKDIKDIDIFFVPISGTYVMDEEDAIKAIETIKPRIVVPMHYNYLEGLEKDPRKFKEKVEKRINNIKTIILIE